jgi:hypothetical protein
MRKFGAIAIVLAVTALTANAGVITTFEYQTTVTIGGTDYNVYDMMVDTTQDWTNSTLHIVLSSGSFYNTVPYGSDTEPNPDFFLLVPDLEWDTCATVPAGYPALASFTPGAQFGQTPDNPPDSTPAFPPTNTQIKAGWFDTSTTGPDGRVARLTISSDANGTLTGSSYNAVPGSTEPEKGMLEGYAIVDGHIIPEPATLALLGLGSLMAIRRKK